MNSVICHKAFRIVISLTSIYVCAGFSDIGQKKVKNIYQSYNIIIYDVVFIMKEIDANTGFCWLMCITACFRIFFIIRCSV